MSSRLKTCHSGQLQCLCSSYQPISRPQKHQLVRRKLLSSWCDVSDFTAAASTRDHIEREKFQFNCRTFDKKIYAAKNYIVWRSHDYGAQSLLHLHVLFSVF